MSQYTIDLNWSLEAESFTYETYNRSHTVTFAGGEKLACSAAPEYLGDAKLANPEELIAAAVSSCHMLTFLAIAAKKKLKVLRYDDRAVAHLGKNAEGRIAITAMELHPVVQWGADPVEPSELSKLHEKAHAACFVANSINFPVSIR